MDLEKELSKALADPDIMNKVSGMLASMTNTDNNKEETPASAPDLGGAGNILGALKSAPADDRTRLLYALKPFLSEKRAPYMDSAVTILKLASLGKLSKDLKLF